MSGGSNFYAVGGGESGHIAVDPRDSDVIWAGSYGGSITRMDRETGVTRNVRSYEDSQTGQQAADMKYRFQWNAPIRISPHDPDTVYHTSQYVHRTQDAGINWEVISPDLTTNDVTKQGYSGGEGITRDNTGVEVYTTIFSFEESPITAGLLWAGSDDGLIHISQDNGDDVGEHHAGQHGGGRHVNQIDMSAHDRRPGARRGLQVPRAGLPAVHLPDQRLRRDLDAADRRHQRHPGQSLRALRAGGSEPPRAAVRRHRVRHVRLVRRRRRTGSRSNSTCR